MKLVDMAYDINHLMISLDHKVTEQEEQDKRKKTKPSTWPVREWIW